MLLQKIYFIPSLVELSPLSYFENTQSTQRYNCSSVADTLLGRTLHARTHLARSQTHCRQLSLLYARPKILSFLSAAVTCCPLFQVPPKCDQVKLLRFDPSVIMTVSSNDCIKPSEEPGAQKAQSCFWCFELSAQLCPRCGLVASCERHWEQHRRETSYIGIIAAKSENTTHCH